MMHVQATYRPRVVLPKIIPKGKRAYWGTEAVLFLLHRCIRSRSQELSATHAYRDTERRKQRQKEKEKEMPRGHISAGGPTVDVFIDMGHPVINRTVDGFLKIGAVAASRAAAEESYHSIRQGSVSSKQLEHALKNMCREGALWGTIAGVYVGMEYGIERIRGRSDWKNAMIGGALTGALVSAAKSNPGDKIMVDAIAGGAIATASVFVNRLI